MPALTVEDEPSFVAANAAAATATATQFQRSEAEQIKPLTFCEKKAKKKKKCDLGQEMGGRSSRGCEMEGLDVSTAWGRGGDNE